MGGELAVAVLSFAGTLLGSLFGVLSAQKLTAHRLSQLEHASDVHRGAIDEVRDRTGKLEGRVTEAEHDIRDLKQGALRGGV